MNDVQGVSTKPSCDNFTAVTVIGVKLSGSSRDCIRAKAGWTVYAHAGAVVLSEDGSTVYATDGSSVIAELGSLVIAEEGSEVIANAGSAWRSMDSIRATGRVTSTGR